MIDLDDVINTRVLIYVITVVRLATVLNHGGKLPSLMEISACREFYSSGKLKGDNNGTKNCTEQCT